MRYFVRQNIKAGRCGSFNQNYESSISDKVFNLISQEYDVNDIIFDFLDKYFEFTKKHRKIIKNELGSQLEDYRGNFQDKKAKYLNDKLGKLP